MITIRSAPESLEFPWVFSGHRMLEWKAAIRRGGGVITQFYNIQKKFLKLHDTGLGKDLENYISAL